MSGNQLLLPKAISLFLAVAFAQNGVSHAPWPTFANAPTHGKLQAWLAEWTDLTGLSILILLFAAAGWPLNHAVMKGGKGRFWTLWLSFLALSFAGPIFVFFNSGTAPVEEWLAR